MAVCCDGRVFVVAQAAQLEADDDAKMPRKSIVSAKKTASVTRPISGQAMIMMPTIDVERAERDAPPAAAFGAEREHDPDHALGDQVDAEHDHDREQALAGTADADQPGDQREHAEDARSSRGSSGSP